MHLRRAILVAVSGAALVVGCSHGSPSGPTPPPPTGNPELSCSAVTVGSVVGGSKAVNYPAPSITGGVPPYNTSCTPASGSTFPVGSTTVSCTATDAAARSGSCSFQVTLTAAQLGAMTFVAFGDSITAGDNGSNDPGGDTQVAKCVSAAAARAAQAAVSSGPAFIDYQTSYPTQLKTLLSGDFPGQTFTVVNEGAKAEYASSADNEFAGDTRLPCVLGADHPDVLLLLEGINDIDFPTGTVQSAMANVPVALANDVRAAQAAGVRYVFVSNLLPVFVGPCPLAPDGCRNNIGNEIVSAVNANIAGAVQQAGATVVDSYDAFLAKDPSLATLLNGDGLHPTPAGYQVLAQTFLSKVIATVPASALTGRR